MRFYAARGSYPRIIGPAFTHNRSRTLIPVSLPVFIYLYLKPPNRGYLPAGRLWTAVDFGYADRMGSSCTIAETIAHHLPTLITPPDHNRPGKNFQTDNACGWQQEQVLLNKNQIQQGRGAIQTTSSSSDTW